MEYLITPKYCDANSILLINHTGILRKLYCPFMVYCRTEIGTLNLGMQLWVEGVSENMEDELHYCIMGRFYSYRFFEINSPFNPPKTIA